MTGYNHLGLFIFRELMLGVIGNLPQSIQHHLASLGHVPRQGVKVLNVKEWNTTKRNHELHLLYYPDERSGPISLSCQNLTHWICRRHCPANHFFCNVSLEQSSMPCRQDEPAVVKPMSFRVIPAPRLLLTLSCHLTRKCWI